MTKYTDPDSGQTIYKYNAFGDLLSVTDPKGQTTTFEHDDAGRITKEIRPMGQALVYDYDESGRLESATSPDARKKLYSYDLDDRLETVRYFVPSSGSPEKTITFTYNAAGLVESWNDGTLSGSYEYDASGRKTKETVNYGAFSKEFSYEYHKNGLKKSFTDSESRQYSYSWDKAGRLEAINLPTGATVSYTNMVMAGPEQINLPGGAYQKISHDGFMRLSGQSSFEYSGSKNLERNYTRTGTGNITKVTGSAGEFVYGYDALDRLASSDAPGTAMDENFAYDKAGNRVFASNVNGPIAHNANNQTSQYGADSFEYDANGNTIKMKLPVGVGQADGKIANLTWDGENRLVKVEDGGAVIATYGYDPFGRRLWKDAKGVKTFFLYSDEGLIGEFDSTGIEIKSYGWKPGGTWGTDPVFMQKSGQYYFYHNDHLGTPRMMTSVTGNVVWKAEYEAFGKADVTVGVIENNLRFPGQYFDIETGLHYNWNRYYEPGVGRYISEDPIGLDGGLNVYGYVLNNPFKSFDPKGLLRIHDEGLSVVQRTQFDNALALLISKVESNKCIKDFFKKFNIDILDILKDGDKGPDVWLGGGDTDPKSPFGENRAGGCVYIWDKAFNYYSAPDQQMKLLATTLIHEVGHWANYNKWGIMPSNPDISDLPKINNNASPEVKNDGPYGYTAEALLFGGYGLSSKDLKKCTCPDAEQN